MSELDKLKNDVLDLAKKAEYEAGFTRYSKDRLRMMAIAARLRRAIEDK